MKKVIKKRTKIINIETAFSDIREFINEADVDTLAEIYSEVP